MSCYFRPDLQSCQYLVKAIFLNCHIKGNSQQIFPSSLGRIVNVANIAFDLVALDGKLTLSILIGIHLREGARPNFITHVMRRETLSRLSRFELVLLEVDNKWNSERSHSDNQIYHRLALCSLDRFEKQFATVARQFLFGVVLDLMLQQLLH